MQYLLISGYRHCLRSINDSVNVGLKNLSISNSNDAVAIQATDMTASNACEYLVNLTTRH